MNKIIETKDYNRFKFITSNRNINLLHVKEISKSIKEKGLLCPIQVDSKYQIIDGQHRFTAAKELGVPIKYYVVDNANIGDVHELNTLSKNWSFVDYLDSYVKSGNINYIKVKELMLNYNIPLSSMLTVLTGYCNKYTQDKFKSGEFIYSDKNAIILTYLQIIKGYYPGAFKKFFILAITQCCKNEKFDITLFVEKLKKQPLSLVDCANTKQYVECIQKIYNTHNRDKIILI